VPAGRASWASAFHPHVGTSFRIDGSTDVLRLLDVSEPPRHGRIEQFSLVFASDTPIDDGIHTLVHPALGRQDLFVSRIGATGAERYEACFTRHVTREDHA
jgi:hypothetical protein